ncbi:MAG: S4 domain-containing protein, partial [Vicinamibacterales bacterium]
MLEIRTLTADRGDAGQRLDLVLRRHLTDVRAATRTRVQRWITEGLVTINGARITRSAARTVPGDIVRITVPEAHQPRPVTAEPMPLVVVYEDGDLMVVDKPAGVVVHPTYRNYERTIMNGLLWHA